MGKGKESWGGRPFHEEMIKEIGTGGVSETKRILSLMAGRKSTVVYENLKVFSTSGELIFRCDR